MTALYEASPIRRSPIKRVRATNAEMEKRYAALVELAEKYGPCSVRQLYYRATVAGLVAKTESGANRVQRALLHLRRSGRVSYHLIVDGTRIMRKPTTFDSVEQALWLTAATYRRALWTDSDYRLEVWCESDSIGSTIADVTSRWDVPLMTCRGYASESFLYAAAEAWKYDPGRMPVVLYIGDHDPAGLDIERVARERLSDFYCDGQSIFEWERIAVTWLQVEEYDLPGGKPKRPYGYPLAVEAEALEPTHLRELLDAAITGYVDQHQLALLETAEESERTILRRIRARDFIDQEDDA